MATPIESSTKSLFLFRDSNSGYFFNAQMQGLRHQTVDPGEDPPDYAEESQKTRRVNPQRLAARLGPEIVAEMEALIYPGAKMPTFEVRRVIQERYSVDRRHIYDYFHSRGLRVAKEDKHTNLTRGRLSKALAQQALKEMPSTADPDLLNKTSTGIELDQTMDKKRSDSGPTTTLPPKDQRAPAQRLLVKQSMHVEKEDQMSFRNAKRVASQRISGLKRKRRRRVPSGGPSSYADGEHLSARKHNKEDFVHTHVNLPTRTPSPCPEFTMSEDSLDRRYGMESPGLTFSSSSDPIVELWDIASDSNYDISLDETKRDTLTSIHEHRPLTEKERLELYNLINNNIGAAHGIEECVGSYRAYMQDQSQYYFDCISFKTNRRTKHHPVMQEDSYISDQINGDVEVDFQQWFSVPEEYGRPKVPRNSLIHLESVHNSEHEFKPDSDVSPQHSDMRVDIQGRPDIDRLEKTMEPTSVETDYNTLRPVRQQVPYPGSQHKHQFELAVKPLAAPPIDVPAESKRNQAIIEASTVSDLHHDHPDGWLSSLYLSTESTPRDIRLDPTSLVSSRISNLSSVQILATSCLAASRKVHSNSFLERDTFKSTLQVPRLSRVRTTSAGGGI